MVERHAEPNAIPLVLDHGDGTASYGFADSRWALDLDEWVMADPAVPQEQRDRTRALLLEQILRPLFPATRRKGQACASLPPRTSAESDASWPHVCSASKGERSPLCSARSAWRGSCLRRYPKRLPDYPW